jgi:hypothetical protein
MRWTVSTLPNRRRGLEAGKRKKKERNRGINRAKFLDDTKI